MRLLARGNVDAAGWSTDRNVRRTGWLAWPIVAMIGLGGCGIGPFESDPDCASLLDDPSVATQAVDDHFDGNGPLEGYVTNNADVLPDVARVDGRYRAVLTENDEDKTLHFFSSQGRLDARPVSFPFDHVVRNIGIGTIDESQVAPAPPADGSAFVFAGVQVHGLALDEPNSSHVVVGHRGGTTFTVEGKNTCDGVSAVDDDGDGAAPSGRVDLRIVGNADRTLTVYYQEPNLEVGSADDWRLYRGTGTLPGEAPAYGDIVYIGLITYAQGEAGLPFVGTADGIEDYSDQG